MKHRFPEPRYVEFSVRFLLVGFLGNIFGIWLVFLEHLDFLLVWFSLMCFFGDFFTKVWMILDIFFTTGF